MSTPATPQETLQQFKVLLQNYKAAVERNAFKVIYPDHTWKEITEGVKETERALILMCVFLLGGKQKEQDHE